MIEKEKNPSQHKTVIIEFVWEQQIAIVTLCNGSVDSEFRTSS